MLGNFSTEKLSEVNYCTCGQRQNENKNGVKNGHEINTRTEIEIGSGSESERESERERESESEDCWDYSIWSCEGKIYTQWICCLSAALIRDCYSGLREKNGTGVVIVFWL